VTIFVDTSALFALLVRNDAMHDRARATFDALRDENECLLTSTYVLLETVALLQRRVGLDAVSDFQMKIQPLLEIIWVDEQWHERAMRRLLAENDETLSLVDCLSFEIMETRALDTAYAYDKHFVEHGFAVAGGTC
jgi:predicted nucleic acid-binding protein